jgi:tungstate transport system substrate-binding protein
MHYVKEASLLRRLGAMAFAVLLVSALTGCQSPGSTSEPTVQREVILASTTSTEDSGLFEALIPAFKDANPEYSAKVIAVGTGEALQLGRTKDADVLLVHAKSDEETFVEEGYGVERADVMYNDFVIVGPSDNPARLPSADVAAAMKILASNDAVFVSRGDDSGTNKKELKLWAAASVSPTASPDLEYLETGQGMGETLKVASEKAAYTLTDRATFLSMKDALDLEVIVEKDANLLNQYGVIVVEGARNQAGGQAFFDWIVSDDGQQVIAEYGVEEYGEPLFVPNAE